MISSKIKKMKWNQLSSFQKHMILMYLYRVETDCENIGLYLEASRFKSIGYPTDQIPESILNASALEKRSMAYAVISEH